MSKLLRTSKTLSYWLRHAPEAGNLHLDSAGWADTKAVLEALDREGLVTTRPELDRLVAESDKNRFEISPDGKKVRARQGHSVAVEAGWRSADPPEFLYHGTVARFVEAILDQGLLPKARHHVHLSVDIETARIVGQRRGAPVIFEISAHELARSGMAFRLSSNGVWLVDHVPSQYLRLLPGPDGR